jgi:pilus assembly protein CpaB
MKRRALGVLAALGLTLFGTLLLVGYVHGAEGRAVAGERLVDVLVVAQPIKKGTPAGDLNGKVKLQQVPAKVRPDTAVADLSSLRGLVATADLAAGEELVSGRFGKPDTLDVTGGIDTTKLVKVTASLDAERAVGGQLKPGDVVAVTISADNDKDKVTHVLIHQVPVVSVSGAVVSSDSADTKKKGGLLGSSSSNTKVMVTLGLNEAQQGQFVWGLEHGAVWLGLEPAAADQSGTGTVHFGGLFG